MNITVWPVLTCKGQRHVILVIGQVDDGVIQGPGVEAGVRQAVLPSLPAGRVVGAQ